jgi:hypothetical protein
MCQVCNKNEYTLKKQVGFELHVILVFGFNLKLEN